MRPERWDCDCSKYKTALCRICRMANYSKGSRGHEKNATSDSKKIRCTSYGCTCGSFSEMNYPEFSEAEHQLIEFIGQHNFPRKIEWVNKSTVAYLGRSWVIFPSMAVNARNKAEKIYKKGKLRPHGMKLAVLGANKTISYCYIFFPRTDLEAQYALMGNGLKLSVRTNCKPCVREFGWLKRFLYRVKELRYLRWKSAMFN